MKNTTKEKHYEQTGNTLSVSYKKEENNIEGSSPKNTWTKSQLEDLSGKQKKQSKDEEAQSASHSIAHLRTCGMTGKREG